MTRLSRYPHHLVAILVAAALAAGPAAAERGDKADRHAQKWAEKADRQAGKHAERVWKDREKASKRAGPGPRHEAVVVRPGAYFSDRHRQFARSYYTEHYGRGRNCPPGLAKKHNGCMPPGQARKFRLGERLPPGVALYAVPQPVLVQLPPPPYGYRYARVGNDIVLMQVSNHIVIDVIYNLFG